MRETLRLEVAEFLREHGARTAPEIAMGIRARRDDVDEILAGAGFERVPHPEGASPRGVYFMASLPVPERVGRRSRAAAMLAVLQDGKRHSRDEIFRRSGRYFLTNNAASELRVQGYDVQKAVEKGRVVVYWLNQPAVRSAALAVGSGRRLVGGAEAGRSFGSSNEAGEVAA